MDKVRKSYAKTCDSITKDVLHPATLKDICQSVDVARSTKECTEAREQAMSQFLDHMKTDFGTIATQFELADKLSMREELVRMNRSTEPGWRPSGDAWADTVGDRLPHQRNHVQKLREEVERLKQQLKESKACLASERAAFKLRMTHVTSLT